MQGRAQLRGLLLGCCGGQHTHRDECMRQPLHPCCACCACFACCAGAPNSPPACWPAHRGSCCACCACCRGTSFRGRTPPAQRTQRARSWAWRLRRSRVSWRGGLLCQCTVLGSTLCFAVSHDVVWNRLHGKHSLETSLAQLLCPPLLQAPLGPRTSTCCACCACCCPAWHPPLLLCTLRLRRMKQSYWTPAAGCWRQRRCTAPRALNARRQVGSRGWRNCVGHITGCTFMSQSGLIQAQPQLYSRSLEVHQSYCLNRCCRFGG